MELMIKSIGAYTRKMFPGMPEDRHLVLGFLHEAAPDKQCRLLMTQGQAKVLRDKLNDAIDWNDGEPNKSSNRRHEQKFAKLGYEMYRRVTSAVAEANGDEWCDQIMEEAERIGLARKEQYDPEVHGDGVNAERGDIIWFWEPFVDESILIAAPEPELQHSVVLGTVDTLPPPTLPEESLPPGWFAEAMQEEASKTARRIRGEEACSAQELMPTPLTLTDESAKELSDGFRREVEIRGIAQQLALIGDEIRTQDNRGTSDVAFFVNVKERIPTDPEFSCCDEWAFHDHDAVETYYHDGPDRERWEELSKLHEDDELTELVTPFRYVEVWKTVQVCFTEKAAKEHLEYNRHRYTSYHGAEVYGESFYRNPEMLQIRNALIRLSELCGKVDTDEKRARVFACNPPWNDKELDAIESLARSKGMSPAQVVRQSLRLYHAEANGACKIVWPPPTPPPTPPKESLPPEWFAKAMQEAEEKDAAKTEVAP